MDKPPLGQHFLVDPGVLDRLVEAARLQPGETVLDVGAGDGAIALRAAAAVGPRGRCIAIEVDPALATSLRARAPRNLDVVEADALTTPLPAADAVVANPPFKLASPLVLRLLDAKAQRLCLVLPAELADRFLARPGDERYGRLTVQVRLRADVARLFDVPRRAFAPPPRVPCCVVRLAPKPLPAGVDGATLDAVLACAWESRRRTLRHGLAPLAMLLHLSSGHITEALRARGWSDKRPSDLAPAEYADLAAALAPDARRL